MRRMLLAGEVMDVLYYTHMLARNTLMASGDLTLEEYLVILDAALQEVSTPREIARAMGVDAVRLAEAAETCAEENLLLRSRSPLDGRVPGYIATAEGRRKALVLNKLLQTVACDFWRVDKEGVARLVDAVAAFQRQGLDPWPESEEAPVRLKSLCALFGLWREYRDFGAKFSLSFSEMHMLTITHQFGPQPNHPLYRDRNMFATNDYAANVMLSTEKGLMEDDGTFFHLTESGKRKVQEMLAACDPPTPSKDTSTRGPLTQLYDLCLSMTRHAMANSSEVYRATKE